MRINKLTAISLLLVAALWSCGGEQKVAPGEPKETSNDKAQGEPMASGEIIDRYVNKLTTAPGQARAAGAAVEERNRRTQEALGD